MKGNRFFSRKLAAFNLTELLVVLVIIGILVLMAMPVLMPLISKTRSIEAKTALTTVHKFQKAYFMEHSRFAEKLDDIGFEREALVTESENGSANYEVEIVQSGPSMFTARATAVVDFDGDGEFNVWEIDQEGSLKEIIKD